MPLPEAANELRFVQVELESLPPVDEDNGDLLRKFLESLWIVEDIDFPPFESTPSLQGSQLGLHRVAETAAGLGVNKNVIHSRHMVHRQTGR